MFPAFWRILMQGPPDTPYEKGVFELYCQFGPDYPVKPPLVRFVTHVSCQDGENDGVMKCDTFTVWKYVMKLQFIRRKFLWQVFLNRITGVSLQRQQCGPHLPQHLRPKLQCPHYHERGLWCCVWTAHHPWAWRSTGQVRCRRRYCLTGIWITMSCVNAMSKVWEIHKS